MGNEDTTRYEPKPLGAPLAGDLSTMVQAAKQRRLVLYLGAGISMAPPSSGPTGWAVAERLKPIVASMLGTEPAELEGLSLEKLSQRVADDAPNRLEELRGLAAEAFEFRGIDPNYGHEAAALLMREGLAKVISVNWDCAIERAGVRCDIEVSSVVDARDSVQLVHRLPLYKVHGCATRAPTLALTKAEVDKPQAWAVGLTQDAVSGGVIVFVGLATVGLYVREPFEQLRDAWLPDAATLFIVDPDLKEDWSKALPNGKAEEQHVALEADAFFDELLRAVVGDALNRTDLAARALAAHGEAWAEAVVEGFEKLRGALEGATADSVLRWWRDGVIETQAGQPFITEPTAQNCLIAVAQLIANDGGEVGFNGLRGGGTVASGKRYFEIVRRPGQHVNAVKQSATDRVHRRLQERVYAEPRPVTFVVAEARGHFPAEIAPPDISGGKDDPLDIAGGPFALPVSFVSAEDAVQGRLAA
jgi:hypothetical protein